MCFFKTLFYTAYGNFKTFQPYTDACCISLCVCFPVNIFLGREFETEYVVDYVLLSNKYVGFGV